MSDAKPFRLPPCIPSPRSDILPPMCSAIDIFLKRTKSNLRDAQAIFSSHQAEMALLERLYYKGKNQHRMSLFWQRVCEMRRYGRRLQDMNITGMMENNRAMFYGVQAPVNSKQLKGAWTHCPTASSLYYILRRLELCFQLLDKSRSRLQDIYRSFVLVMQDGAFLHLTLTMIAIACRLDHLLLSASSLIRDCHATCHELLQSLDSKRAAQVKPLHREQESPAPPQLLPTSIPGPSESITAPMDEDLGDEDIGQTTSRSTTEGANITTESTTSTNQIMVQEEEEEILSYSELQVLSLPPLPSIMNQSTAPKPMPLVSRTAPAFLASSSSSGIAVKKRKQPDPASETVTTSVKTKTSSAGSEEPQPKKAKKKKKKKRDEIDDIFG